MGTRCIAREGRTLIAVIVRLWGWLIGVERRLFLYVTRERWPFILVLRFLRRGSRWRGRWRRSWRSAWLDMRLVVLVILRRGREREESQNDKNYAQEAGINIRT